MQIYRKSGVTYKVTTTQLFYNIFWPLQQLVCGCLYKKTSDENVTGKKT